MWLSDLLSIGPEIKEECYFKDNRRRVDYVIVPTDISLEPLSTYMNKLEALGLEMEVNEGITIAKKFILIHLPMKANRHFAEFYNVGLVEHRGHFKVVRSMWFPTIFTTPISLVPPKKKDEFTSAERIILINKLLEDTMYGSEVHEKGISQLIRVGLVETAYPLHDGYYHNDQLMYSNDRQLLYHHWSKLTCWYKEMPLDMIQKYFGWEIAFYFAWLEFFNYRLILAATIGSLAIFINYMLVTSVPIAQIEEICHEDNMLVCPTCEFGKYCTYKPLSSYCESAKHNYMFDNYITVAFAAFTSFWATSFMYWWRRKENKLKLRWDAQYQNPVLCARQEYIDAAKEMRLNRITGNLEPYVAKHISYLRMAFSLTVCLLLAFLVLVGICAMMIFDVIMESQMDSGQISFIRKNSRISVFFTASFINVIVVKLFAKMFARLAIWLTDVEIPRTQYDYDKSHLYKRFLLAFANNYMNFFYLAFLKGRLYTVPNRYQYFRFLERHTCQPLNCILEICIWMSFLLLLKKFAINVVKIIIENSRSCINMLRGRVETYFEDIPQYEADYKLEPTDRFLITSYFIDMAIAYGHVTLFVAAFPLAPLCILVNNILEVRIQARDLIANSRRPVPRISEGIGSWFGILMSMSFLSIMTNAFVIAFTSSFIEREIYQHNVDYDLKGYINSTLSKFATKDYNVDLSGHQDTDICYYRSRRFPPGHAREYQLTSDYWIELTWKFVFVLVFEHIILACNVIFAYMVPFIPRSVRVQLKLDRKLTKEAKYKYYLGYWRWRKPKPPKRGVSVDVSVSGLKI